MPAGGVADFDSPSGDLMVVQGRDGAYTDNRGRIYLVGAGVATRSNLSKSAGEAYVRKNGIDLGTGRRPRYVILEDRVLPAQVRTSQPAPPATGGLDVDDAEAAGKDDALRAEIRTLRLEVEGLRLIVQRQFDMMLELTRRR